MEREAGIGRFEGTWDGDDDTLSAYLESLPRRPGLPETEQEVAESDARADADVAAGRVVPHHLVAAWIDKLGTPDEEPMPREWLR